MQSLFLKIFLWFLLALALVITTLLLAVAQTRLERPFEPAISASWPLRAQLAATLFEHHGPPLLTVYFQTLEPTFATQAYLFHADGTEALGRAAPPSVTRVAAQAGHTERLAVHTAGRTRVLAQPGVGPSGRRYILVLLSEYPLGRMLILGGQPIVDVVPLLTVLVVGGGCCWWLARHITTPVRQLRAATQHLADGKLETRVGRGVTDRHDELADLGQHFDRMAARLEALLTSQQLLFRNVSHELRSPLARVQVALGLLRQHTETAAARYLERIDREVERLNRLIGQFLTLARLESGMEVAQGEVCDLRALVQEVVADGDFEAQARQGTVTLVAAEVCRVSGATELLRSALENVVRNAVRYTTVGTTTEVRVYGDDTPAGHHAVIEVRDYGPGVPEAELAQLFQPFYRLTQTRAPQPDGTGLGLAITERVVQLHGGTLAAANAPGGGLRVTIRLPMLPTPPTSEEVSTAGTLRP